MKTKQQIKELSDSLIDLCTVVDAILVGTCPDRERRHELAHKVGQARGRMLGLQRELEQEG